MSEDATLDEFVEAESEVKGEFVETAAGQLPVDWDTKNVGELCELRNGKATSHTGIGEQRFLVYGSNGPIGSYSESNFDGGLIFGRVGAVGEVERVQEPVWVSDNAIQASVTDKCNVDFVYYYLSNKDLSSLATKTAQPLLNQSTIGNVTVPSPPLPEQRKIATVLHTVDRLIEKTQEVIESYEAARKGILRELISRGVARNGEFRPDPDENPDLYYETRWGQIPEKWETEKVSELVVDGRGVTYGIVKAGEHVPGGVPMIRGENYISGWEPVSEFFRVSEEIHEEYNRSAVRSGDILLAVAGANAGAVNIVPEWMPDEANISRSTARISVDGSDVIPEFMRFVLESPFLRKQIHAWKKGSAQDVLNLGDVKNFQIPLPPVNEQKRIVSILSNIREATIKERTVKTQYSRLKRGLMEDLLSGTVRTTDTNIEVPDEIAQHG